VAVDNDFDPEERARLLAGPSRRARADLSPARMSMIDAADRAQPWRVDTLARDFRLEDRWTFDLGGRPAQDVGELLPVFWGIFRRLDDSWLAKTRLRIGRALGWDEHDFTLPIPGCTETTLSARLGDEDRRRNLAADDAPSPVPSPLVKTVYVFHDEALYEISNDTIHALLHIAVSGASATLSVYVKWRGLYSRLYMAAIWPARHLVLYPALVRKLEAAWRRAPATAEATGRPAATRQ
jgi:hypothetical protein